MPPEIPKLWVASWTFIFCAGLLAPIMGHLLATETWRQRSTDLSLLLALLGSAVGVLGAGLALVDPATWSRTIDLFQILAPISDQGYLPPVIFQIKVDPLAAGFALLIAAFAAVVAIYSFSALRAPHFRRQQGWIAAAFNGFVWATMMVVVVNDLFSMIVVLEIMTLAFAWLALYKQDLYQQEPPEHAPDPEKRKEANLAPQVYLIVSHTSTAFLLLASLLLVKNAGGDSFSFDALRAAPASSTLVFLLVLAGLGIRAGLTPAHFWVSLVHPASPTTTHAFSLGIAIKVAVYLMIRFFFQFMTPQLWWGFLLLALAVVTAVVNVWYAIASHDLKKALAYHSIENVGIIVAGVGAALIYQASSQPTLAILALTAGLYHVLNHAIFKGLLYLNTGAIERQTNQIVDIEKLGGLMKIWPWTAVTFLVGAVSIAGFPPLNGFVSEWLTLQALVRGLHGTSLSLQSGVLVLSTVFLFVSFALTAFCFVKITGLALLGSPRAQPETVDRWRHQPDAPWPMRSMMLALAGLCLLIGLFPMGVMQVLSTIARDALGNPKAASATPFTFGLTTNLLPAAQPDYAMLSIFLVTCLLGVCALLAGKARLRGKRHVVPVDDPWNCGTPYVVPGAQVTGAGLSFLIRDLFGAGWAPRENMSRPDYLPANLLLSAGAARGESAARQAVVEVFRVAYNHLIDRLLRTSRRVETASQNGDLRRYLLYIMFANLGALVAFFLLWMRR